MHAANDLVVDDGWILEPCNVMFRNETILYRLRRLYLQPE